MYPEPVFIIGAKVNNKANFMPASWVTRVYSNPNIMLVSLNTNRHTYMGIKENKVFSMNIPSTYLVAKTDYCALVSGKNTDKSKVLEVVYGDLKTPMIQECPLCAECKLIKTVALSNHDLVIGEVINTYIDENYLTDKTPDITKINPFVFTMPDNNYWNIGETFAKAWSIGNKIKS